jgi:hypothetical protein
MKLHEQKTAYKQMTINLLEGLNGIRNYLESSKFDTDNMVNKNDILLRIREILNAHDDLSLPLFLDEEKRLTNKTNRLV